MQQNASIYLTRFIGKKFNNWCSEAKILSWSRSRSSGRLLLNSHTVAAPMSKRSQEVSKCRESIFQRLLYNFQVSGYVNYNIGMEPEVSKLLRNMRRWMETLVRWFGGWSFPPEKTFGGWVLPTVVSGFNMSTLASFSLWPSEWNPCLLVRSQHFSQAIFWAAIAIQNHGERAWEK